MSCSLHREPLQVNPRRAAYSRCCEAGGPTCGAFNHQLSPRARQNEAYVAPGLGLGSSFQSSWAVSPSTLPRVSNSSCQRLLPLGSSVCKAQHMHCATTVLRLFQGLADAAVGTLWLFIPPGSGLPTPTGSSYQGASQAYDVSHLHPPKNL